MVIPMPHENIFTDSSDRIWSRHWTRPPQRVLPVEALVLRDVQAFLRKRDLEYFAGMIVPPESMSGTTLPTSPRPNDVASFSNAFQLTKSNLLFCLVCDSSSENR